MPVHGAADLPTVHVDSYSAELRDGGDALGSRANKQAFCAILDDWRERLDKTGADPLGDLATDELSKKKLEKLLSSDDLEAAGLILGAIEEFAQELARVIGRFLRLKSWTGTQRIAIGGGFRRSRIGELAIGRAAVLTKAAGHKIDLVPIHHHVDEAGLIGAIHLAPNWIFAGHDAILAADIGGTNIRCGVVTVSAGKKNAPADGEVRLFEKWRHIDVKPSRAQAVDHLIETLSRLSAQARKEKLKLAPFVGLGCPGVIEEDGTLKSGGENLPGNWESSRFNLASTIRAGLSEIEGEKPMVMVHNDAVIQGLSQLPFMQDIKQWGILTIGTGLGNARFTNLSD
jgi:hypothetical protein